MTQQDAMVANRRRTGWVLFALVMATTAGLVGQEIQALETFDEMWTPGFVGKSLIHVGSVVVSFFGGRSSAAR